MRNNVAECTTARRVGGGEGGVREAKGGQAVGGHLVVLQQLQLCGQLRHNQHGAPPQRLLAAQNVTIDVVSHIQHLSIRQTPLQQHDASMPQDIAAYCAAIYAVPCMSAHCHIESDEQDSDNDHMLCLTQRPRPREINVTTCCIVCYHRCYPPQTAAD